MSDCTSLELPFPHRRSPHQARAAAHHRLWLDRHSRLAACADESAYAHWEVADLAAISYPEAGAEELGLATDLLGFYFLFDDQFDTELGQHPAEVARICDRLTTIVHGAPASGRSPVEQAFADIWRRTAAGMPARWRARAAYNWEWYFASHPAEAAGRAFAELPDRESYMVLRRGTAAMETLFDMIERLGRFEVPQSAFHHPVLRQLRQLAADIPSLSNDVRSYPLEAPRGDVYNLVMIVQQERSCSAEEASAVVLGEAQLMIDRFAALRLQLATVYHQLELDHEQRGAAQRYADGLAAWLAGYLRWEARTGRYRLS
ncbi:terpene cyclase [Kitasatospora sp. NPDC049258]|uniref:terpene synthase family protein n=1 Tax=Kitasatospora sp. NPDC049258 TaxID=3155394 RepID=UPI003428E449